MTAGRPSKYREEFAEQAYKLCLLGSTNEQLADFFEVNPDTIYEWLKNKKKFSESVKKAKEIADAVIAESLYHRAKGYTHDEDKIFQYEGEAVIVPTKKHYPPDATSCIFWLKNRQPEKWRDKTDLEHTGRLSVMLDSTDVGL